MIENIKEYCRGHMPRTTALYRKILFRWREWKMVPRDFREARLLARAGYIPHSEMDLFSKEHYHPGTVPGDEEKPRGIIWIGDGSMFHGGPSDRLRGILTLYREAERRGLPFHISWTHPFDLRDYLLPAEVDWEIERSQLSYSGRTAFPVIAMQTERPLVRLVDNMLIRAACSLPFRQIHVYTNVMHRTDDYPRLYHKLFRPSPLLQEEVERRRTEIGAPYWSFTFRFLDLLGDFKDHRGLILQENERRDLIEKSSAELLRLLQALPDGYRALVTSDSGTFLKHVAGLDPRIYVVPGEVKNIDMIPGEHRSAWLKTFTDQQLIMQAEHVWLMRTSEMYRSGFPRFAALVGARPFTDHCF